MGRDYFNTFVLQQLLRGGAIAHVGAENVIDTLEHVQTRTSTIDVVGPQ
jgi:hypothetical protein